jgi:hypothetical protein
VLRALAAAVDAAPRAMVMIGFVRVYGYALAIIAGVAAVSLALDGDFRGAAVFGLLAAFCAGITTW